MVATRRRSTRSAQHSGQSPTEKIEHAVAGKKENSTSEESCPSCEGSAQPQQSEKESWIRCDACTTWYHWRCVGQGDLETIDKWFCKVCLQADPARLVTLKPPARKSSRKRAQRDYANLNSGMESDPTRWTRILHGKSITKESFKRMNGSDVTLEWLENDESAMKEPLLVENPDGLGMKMPSKSLTVSEISEILGKDFPVEVIDVASQSNSPGWTLGKWAEYYHSEPSKRDKIRNVISLEISDTELADQVLPPKLVRDLDWVEKFWPPAKRGNGHAYPKVQLYCLMSVAQSWTDWHIDFAGSSVYYHIFRGSKIFYFIRPTPTNLAAYERWSGTELQNHSWLGDMCDEVFKVELEEGNTMIIPTGWIHAVYTPIDSLVFGGNFLHSYNIATQLKVRNIEISTHVPKKFRFPMFQRLSWYAGEKYVRDLKAKEEFSPRVLDSLMTLADFLVSEARNMERGTDSVKRDSKEQVPSDKIKDAPALARELRWRLRLASGYGSDGEEPGSKRKPITLKRKRGEGKTEEELVGALFRNFRPRCWDDVRDKREEGIVKKMMTRRPQWSEDEWLSGWLEWEREGESDRWNGGADADSEASVKSQRDIVVKVRKFSGGLERERVERVLERWSWKDVAEQPGDSANSCVESLLTRP